MKRPVLLTALALAGTVSAQRGPLPGIPIVTAVDHPALAAQPLMQPAGKSPRLASPTHRSRTLPAPDGKTDTKGGPEPASPKAPVAKRKPPAVDPDTVGTKASGRELSKLVAKVTDLDWGSKLFDLEARSAATGKPILWLQSLGDIDGRA
ncbi:MAG: hypothetical protein KDE27_29785 [Planctomycetes bacterium]|nr:hypothetical protein [Planctomycetota bacterium]